MHACRIAITSLIEDKVLNSFVVIKDDLYRGVFMQTLHSYTHFSSALNVGFGQSCLCCYCFFFRFQMMIAQNDVFNKATYFGVTVQAHHDVDHLQEFSSPTK